MKLLCVDVRVSSSVDFVTVMLARGCFYFDSARSFHECVGTTSAILSPESSGHVGQMILYKDCYPDVLVSPYTR